tara:strand:+ start:778 stop:939 length:162 start_codon:yes stop_codon:yes gene_type:complete
MVMAQQEVGEPQDTPHLAAQVGTALLVNPRIVEMAVAAVAGVRQFMKVMAAVV